GDERAIGRIDHGQCVVSDLRRVWLRVELRRLGKGGALVLAIGPGDRHRRLLFLLPPRRGLVAELNQPHREDAEAQTEHGNLTGGNVAACGVALPIATPQAASCRAHFFSNNLSLAGRVFAQSPVWVIERTRASVRST